MTLNLEGLEGKTQKYEQNLGGGELRVGARSVGLARSEVTRSKSNGTVSARKSPCARSDAAIV
jgi:hypothetical protein